MQAVLTRDGFARLAFQIAQKTCAHHARMGTRLLAVEKGQNARQLPGESPLAFRQGTGFEGCCLQQGLGGGIFQQGPGRSVRPPRIRSRPVPKKK